MIFKTVTIYFQANEADLCFACAVKKAMANEDIITSLESDDDITCDCCGRLIPVIKLSL